MKVIPLGCSEEERRRILFEARTLHVSAVVGIIAFRDAFCPPRYRRDARRVGMCPPSRAARRRALTWRASCADAEGAVHMVLEYMDCGSLADVLSRHGPLPERLLAHILKALIGGLVHLHRELKVVHRDIKPSNILLNQAGQAKLADFGMSGQLATVHSRLASWVGTAAYMSPERISGAKHSYEARHLGCISDVSRVDLRRISGSSRRRPRRRIFGASAYRSGSARSAATRSDPPAAAAAERATRPARGASGSYSI